MQAKRCLCFQYADYALDSGTAKDDYVPLIKNGGAMTLPNAAGDCEPTSY